MYVLLATLTLLATSSVYAGTGGKLFEETYNCSCTNATSEDQKNIELKIVVEEFLGTKDLFAKANMIYHLGSKCGLSITEKTYTCEKLNSVEVQRGY
jgi:hypothetical protein